MGYFVKGEYIYIRGKIVEVNAQDSTKYRIQTDLANFYVTERGDTLASDPSEIFTAPEMYALMQNIANMTDDDLRICFGDDIKSLTDVVTHGWDITEIRTMYLEWELANKVAVGDMVYYLPEDAAPGTAKKICAVLAITEGDVSGTHTDDTYVLYDDVNNIMYDATRAEITSAHLRSRSVISVLTDLDKAVKEARERIG